MNYGLLFPLFALAVGIGLTGRVSADEPKTTGAPHSHQSAFTDCAKACHDCARSCTACGAHCTMLVADGKKDHLKSLRTCQDCATICAAAASVTARSGPFSDAICIACADACKRCGDECAKHKDDAMMKACADECKKCETACREMLKHVGMGPGK